MRMVYASPEATSELARVRGPGEMNIEREVLACRAGHRRMAERSPKPAARAPGSPPPRGRLVALVPPGVSRAGLDDHVVLLQKHFLLVVELQMDRADLVDLESGMGAHAGHRAALQLSVHITDRPNHLTGRLGASILAVEIAGDSRANWFGALAYGPM